MSNSNTVLARRYAKALFDLALSKKEQDKVDQELGELCKAIEANANLKKVLQNPIISRREQSDLMAAIVSKAGAGELTKSFVNVLAQNRRVVDVCAIREEYGALLNEHKGEVIAHVVSSGSLSKGALTKIEKELGKSLDKKIKIKAKEKEEILGGLVIRVGSKMLDASLLGKIKKIELLSKKAIASI